MSKMIGLLGLINCGKGTVSTYLVDKYDFRQDSFASSLKDAVAMVFDWPRYLLEGDTIESRKWREEVDHWWASRLGIPNFTPRFALQYIGTDVFRNHFHSDLWFLTIQNKMRKNEEQSTVISDVRFSNEIDFIRKTGGTLIRVCRGPDPEWYEIAALANNGDQQACNTMAKLYGHIHASEWSWAGVKPDFTLNNNGTISDLYLQIDDIVRTGRIT